MLSTHIAVFNIFIIKEYFALNLKNLHNFMLLFKLFKIE